MSTTIEHNIEYNDMRARLQELQYLAMEAKASALEATEYVIRIAQRANVLEADGTIPSALHWIDLHEKEAVEAAQIKIKQATLLAREANELQEEIKMKFNIAKKIKTS